MPYGLFKMYRFHRNRTDLLVIIDTLIDSFENEILEDHYCQSCKDILMAEIKIYLNHNRVGISLLDKNHDNFNEIAAATISTVAFEFFEYSKFTSGGKYRSHNYSSTMMSRIHFKSLQWGYNHGYVTKEEMDEDKLAFHDAVRNQIK